MRQVTDDAVLQTDEARRAAKQIRDFAANPFKRPTHTPQYFRDALIKPK